MDRSWLRSIEWETRTVEETLEMLNSQQNGLTLEEAEERLSRLGPNKLPDEKKDGIIKRFLMQFRNALIYVLIGAAVVTALMEHWIDTAVILGVIVINAIVGFIQEDKAQKALEGIKDLLSLKALVIRNGKREEINSEELVPGDIVILKAGDKVPADMRLITAIRLEVDEASLTGESVAVIKSPSPVAPGTVLGDRASMAYTGTMVRTGEATGIVTATASDTEVGKINTMLSETKSVSTPLMRKINQLGKMLSVIILAFSIALVLYDVFIMGTTLSYALLSVIGLAVAAIPEGLPAIMTITLAIGVQRMAQRNAIVRRLPSVETLGSVTVICSDKTGTLTKNEMTATDIYAASGDLEVTGTGYHPAGAILRNGLAIDAGADPVLSRLIQSASLCNDSAVVMKDGVWTAQGAPTEAALKTLAAKAGMAEIDSRAIDAIPFDSKYKYRASLLSIGDRKFLFVNGAPEKLLLLCSLQAGQVVGQPIETALWEKKIAVAAARGQRLIGCAYAEMPDDHIHLDHEDLDGRLMFLGIIGIIDPPRPEAVESIRICRQAGIRVKMITGDHVLTALAIGMQMGLTESECVTSGAELEKMDDSQLREVVQNCDIFARTSPEHKLRLVTALQELGEIVAMTGDGVNDAPALKKADIGIAMGRKGTEVTKDSAEMVLADDNFATIESAVEEGRTIYDNLRKTLLFILPTNGAEAFVILVAILFGLTLPITPVQILWVNMVTAITLALSLAFEPTEENTMKRPPRPADAAIIDQYFLFRIIYVSIVIGLIITYSFFHFDSFGYSMAYSRTITVNMLVFGELFYLFNTRKIYHSIFSRGFWGNRVVFLVSGILIAIQIGFTYLPFMNLWFETAPLDPVDWLYPIIGGILILLIVEFEKFLKNRKQAAGH